LKNQIIQNEKKILLEARKKIGLTQQQVADIAQITIRHYQLFESGERKLSSSSFITASNVLSALQLDLAAFARGDYNFKDSTNNDNADDAKIE
jgi:transcriptional regulator with XRE-family HTH domain